MAARPRRGGGVGQLGFTVSRSVATINQSDNNTTKGKTMTVINVDNLEQIQVLPMDFAWQSGDTDAAGNPVPLRFEKPDHQYVSEAILEAAVLRVGIGDNVIKRDLTDEEVDWVNENEPEWVAEICDEEWQQENNPEY